MITYNKGASMNLMMEHILTRNAFWNGLQFYIEDKKYMNAMTTELMGHLTAAGQIYGTLPPQYDMETIMEGWLT